MLLVAPGHSAGLSVSAHGPLAAILNYSAGYRDSAHGPQSRGVSAAISHHGVSSEGPGVRLLHEVPCEQVKQDSAQREGKEVTLYFLSRFYFYSQGIVDGLCQ